MNTFHPRAPQLRISTLFLVLRLMTLTSGLCVAAPASHSHTFSPTRATAVCSSSSHATDKISPTHPFLLPSKLVISSSSKNQKLFHRLVIKQHQRNNVSTMTMNVATAVSSYVDKIVADPKISGRSSTELCFRDWHSREVCKFETL